MLEANLEIEFQLQKRCGGAGLGARLEAGLGARLEAGLGARLEIATARQRGTCVIPTEFLHPTGSPLLYTFA
ncbi:TPA: hypothetical protein [Thermocrinis Great Boiling Spring virus]|nr:TPA: hypothetical protein [Thermocrinis Great Boiling Spring virus]